MSFVPRDSVADRSIDYVLFRKFVTSEFLASGFVKVNCGPQGSILTIRADGPQGFLSSAESLRPTGGCHDHGMVETQLVRLVHPWSEGADTLGSQHSVVVMRMTRIELNLA